MAISTYQVYLMHGTGSDSTTYRKLIDVKEIPDLGQAPEMIETTTLSDPIQCFIAGIQGSEGLEFPANYDKSDYTNLKALEHKTEKYAVWIGADESGQPDGHNGKFSFEGELSVRVTAGGVNQVLGMGITIAPSKPFTFE